MKAKEHIMKSHPLIHVLSTQSKQSPEMNDGGHKVDFMMTRWITGESKHTNYITTVSTVHLSNNIEQQQLQRQSERIYSVNH